MVWGGGIAIVGLVLIKPKPQNKKCLAKKDDKRVLFFYGIERREKN